MPTQYHFNQLQQEINISSYHLNYSLFSSNSKAKWDDSNNYQTKSSKSGGN